MITRMSSADDRGLAGDEDAAPERVAVVAVAAGAAAAAGVDGAVSRLVIRVLPRFQELAGLSEGEHAVEHDRADDEHADDGALPEVLDAEDRAGPG